MQKALCKFFISLPLSLSLSLPSSPLTTLPPFNNSLPPPPPIVWPLCWCIAAPRPPPLVSVLSPASTVKHTYTHTTTTTTTAPWALAHAHSREKHAAGVGKCCC